MSGPAIRLVDTFQFIVKSNKLPNAEEYIFEHLGIATKLLINSLLCYTCLGFFVRETPNYYP